MESNFTEAQIQELSNLVIQYYKFEILCELIGGVIGIGLAIIFT
jgi:hypothetical protein